MEQLSAWASPRCCSCSALKRVFNYVGPAIRASSASSEKARERFRNDLHAVFSRYNRATDGTAVVENRYLLTVATRA